MFKNPLLNKIKIISFALLLPLSVVLTINVSVANADYHLENRYDNLSDSSAGATAQHTIGFQFQNSTTHIGSILIQFCDNTPLPPGPNIPDCSFPVGMDVSGATLDTSSETGNTGFTQVSATNSYPQDGILLTNPLAPIPDTTVQNTYTIDNIVNPSSPGEYYVRVQTFTSNDGTGPFVEFGGIAISINSSLSISTIVPPYLTFCGGVTITNLNCGSASGDEIDFGDLSNKRTSDATSQFLVATNAQGGYSVSINGDTMTSGNYIIPNLTVPTTSKVGTPQFGVNLVINTAPPIGSNTVGNGVGTPSPDYSAQNNFTFNDGDTIVSSTTASDYNEYTTSYLVNIPAGQPPGVYTTTVYFIALANF